MKTNELITLLSIPGTKLILEAALTSWIDYGLEKLQSRRQVI